MLKFLYALFVVALGLAGLGGFLYGLYLIWAPLSFVIGGVIFVFIALVMNQLYDTSSKGGDE